MLTEHTYAGKPWLASYADGVRPEIDEVTQTLTEMLADSAKRFRSHDALEFFGASFTYRELFNRVRKVAEGLRKLGVHHGDRVAIVLPNCPQHVIAFYAVLRLGAIVVEHNPLYTERELRHQFEDHEAQVAIVWDADSDIIAQFPHDVRPRHIISVDITHDMPVLQQFALRLPIRKAREIRQKLSRKPTAAGLISWRSLMAHRRISRWFPEPKLDDIALLQYTSGTTGTPKGAMLTHRNLRANALQGKEWVPGLREGREVFYGALPLFHAYGMTMCLTFAMSIGALLVLFPTFDEKLIATAAQKHPPTFLPAVPPIYDRLTVAAANMDLDLSAIRFSFSGAMALPVATVRRWEDLTGGLLVEGYGMTEASPIALGNPIGPTRQPGTVGIPFPSTEIRVVDPDHPDQDVTLGKCGELLVRGPQVFTGYWNDPLATAETLLEGGWLRTGDVVTVSQDGFVTVVDRIKELIITGGFNVAPSEVEAVLLTHPDVEDAAVVALPRGDGAEMVAAAIVLHKDASTVGAVEELSGTHDDDHSQSGIVNGILSKLKHGTSNNSSVNALAEHSEAIRNYCRTRLAAYKVPRKIVILDSLPRSIVGKVLRREVREQLIAGS